jgi:rod shape-determining protein MreC
MPARPSYNSHAHSLALHWRHSWRLPSFLVLSFLAVSLLGIGQWRPNLLLPLRTQIVDQLTPVLSVMSEPARLVTAASAQWHEWLNLRQQLTVLQAENARLKNWEQAGLALQTENRELKSLLRFQAEPATTGLTARVIANTGAPYAASLIVTAGAREGVTKNMIAATADGLVGRVIEVGEWSSRILLITDPESRIPVVARETGTRSVLAGMGNNNLEARFLPNDFQLTAGTIMVTSGHGGLLPPNLPVATVGDHSRLYPTVDLSRVNHVRLLDFKLAGGDANALGQGLKAER